MFEKVSKFHPDIIADRIAGALVDLAYKKEKDPRVAVEVLIGHGKCHIINETSVKLKINDVKDAVKRISGIEDVDYLEVPQDPHLSANQKEGFRCGDNGIFKGVEPSIEECKLAYFTKVMDEKYGCDGKYILDKDTLIVCQSNIKTRKSLAEDRTEDEKFIIKTIQGVSNDIVFYNINPIGDWVGGTDVDTGATNRKLGSDMGRGVTGGGLNGKDLSKADVSINIYAYLKACREHHDVELSCAIGDKYVDGLPYSAIVEIARDYIFNHCGGFEKFAEYGLIR